MCMILKTNKSASKSSPIKSNKQKQQRFQEETPDEKSNRQQGRMKEESNPNETKPISRLANRHSPSQTNKSSKGFKKKYRVKDLIVNGEERKKKVIRMRRVTKPISRLANHHSP
ncbi:hypothetical protein RhiirA1_543875, partial [Rhizophagus irregularis]